MSQRSHAPVLVEESARLDVPAQDTWELLIDIEAQQQWLGAGSAIPREGAIVLPANGASWRQGSVLLRDSHAKTVELSVGPAVSWVTPIRTTVEFTVVPDRKNPKARSKIVVTEVAATEADIAAPVHKELRDFWYHALRRLKALAGAVTTRRKSAQAVLVVHGIGEQLPGETLSRFVAAVVGPNDLGELRSKPDRISQSLELRRLTLGSFGNRPKTDFYELYWAHLIRDTTPGQVLAWLGRTLRTRWTDVPAGLRPGWIIGWLAALSIAFALAFFAFSVFRAEGGLALLGALSLVLSSVLTVVSFLLVKGLGDAARYLSARPENVDARERIRLRGVEILERLHASKRYHRIVVVGHSLGSVIAYDVVTALWARTHQLHLRPRRTRFGYNTRVHQYTGDDATAAQTKQHAAWTELRRNTQPWLITDLITAGSPLAHADLLLTRGKDATGKRMPRSKEWQGRQKRREVATAPPERDEKADQDVAAFWYQGDYTDRDERPRRTFRYLHHAAPFAVTRWTNLYFPVRGMLFGDPIGGPIRSLFGIWVRDVRLRAPNDWSLPRKIWSHSSYWHRSEADGAADDPTTPLDLVREALQLECLSDLTKESRAHTPLLYLEEPEA